jgi:hypothetical protein
MAQFRQPDTGAQRLKQSGLASKVCPSVDACYWKDGILELTAKAIL